MKETENRMRLLEAMKLAADQSQVSVLSRFFKCSPGQYGEGDRFLGIKVPVTRSIVKAHWKSTLPENWQQNGFPELEECIGSEYHEIRLAALLSLVEFFSHAKALTLPPCPACSGSLLQERCIDFYLGHTDRINNWDLVDLSCYPLLGQWLLPQKDRSLLYGLAKNGKTIWEQRIGIVSTMAFVRKGELDDTFAIADILLYHPHDLIQKAVGWLLREAGKRDGNALRQYLEPRHKTMPRTMLRYAIEKFPEPERQLFLKK